MFYKKNPIYFIFWDTYICFQRIFRFKSFTYFYMYFLSTIWNDIDFHNWVYWCHLLVGWQKITCGLILLQEEAMSMSKPCQRWDSEIFSLEFTKNLTLSKGEKRKSPMTSGTALSWSFLNINCGNGHKFLGTIISVDLPILNSKYLSSHKKDTTETCSSTESVLTCCITAWYRGCTEAEGSRIQQIINTAQKIVGRENSQWAIS